MAGVEELSLGEGDFECKDAYHLHLEGLEVVIVGCIVVEKSASVVEHVADVDAEAVAVKGVAALVVDDGALVVHHVVVLEESFTHAEVVFLHFLLRLFNLLGDHGVLNDFALLETHAVHDAGDAVGAEDAHEVVFERDEEEAAAGVALTAGTTTQLAVDAAGLVAFGADDGKTAGFAHSAFQLDIGTTTSHIGGDGDVAGFTSMGNDFGLFLV